MGSSGVLKLRWTRIAVGTLMAAVAVALVAALWVSLRSEDAVMQAKHLAGESFEFDFPASWRVLSGHERAGLHGPTVEAAVGIGAFDLGCDTTGTSVSCQDPRWTVPRGGVVLAYRFDPWLPSHPQPTPTLGPGEASVDVGGRPAIQSRTATSALWHFPGAPEFIEARWNPEDSQRALEGVQLAIRTWQWDSP